MPPTLVVPTPAGEPFSQRIAGELAAEPWLLFACGRYEGIDARVTEHPRTRMPVRRIRISTPPCGCRAMPLRPTPWIVPSPPIGAT